MPRGELYPVPYVLSAQAEGMSATAGLAAFRAAGGSVRTQTWYRAWGEAQAAGADALAEASRPLNRRPTGDELTLWTTTSATGYVQQVEVYVRDRLTGLVVAKPYSVMGDELVTRRQAIAEALGAFEANATAYDEQVIGARHVGAFLMSPESGLA